MLCAKKKKNSKKRLILWAIISLNIFSLISSLIFNNYLYDGDKLAQSPFNFFWEWITVFWCVWSTILTCIYSLNELKNESTKKVRKSQEILGLVVAIGNLLSMVIFATYLPKQLSEQGIKRGIFWWTYSITWHFIAIPLSLFYFFKFSNWEEKNIYKKRTFVFLSIQPTLFFFVNIIRRFSAEEKYLTKPWKKYMIPMFNWLEEKKYLNFLLFSLVVLFLFWLIAWCLVKTKKIIYPTQRVKLINNKITKFNNSPLTKKYKK